MKESFVVVENLTLHCDLDYEDNLFRLTLRVMTMHHHTNFGCIQFSGLGDIFRTKV